MMFSAWNEDVMFSAWNEDVMFSAWNEDVMFSAWNEDVHVLWIYSFDYFFLTFFCFVNLFFSSMKCYQSVYTVGIDSGYLVGATPLTVFHRLF